MGVEKDFRMSIDNFHVCNICVELAYQYTLASYQSHPLNKEHSIDRESLDNPTGLAGTGCAAGQDVSRIADKCGPTDCALADSVQITLSSLRHPTSHSRLSHHARSWPLATENAAYTGEAFTSPLSKFCSATCLPNKTIVPTLLRHLLLVQRSPAHHICNHWAMLCRLRVQRPCKSRAQAEQ